MKRITMDEIGDRISKKTFDWNWEDDDKSYMQTWKFFDNKEQPFYIDIKLSGNDEITLTADVMTVNS
jgi:hypothetical protein